MSSDIAMKAGHMLVSTRRKLRRGDPGWPAELPAGVRELRTIDWFLNRYADDSGYVECSPETLDRAEASLPEPGSPDEYEQLAINLDGDFGRFEPVGWRLLGHDLSDETRTSSLHNCGSWTGRLRQFVERLNEFGLLDHKDAVRAQELLPEEWGERADHARTVIWALYERMMQAGRCQDGGTARP